MLAGFDNCCCGCCCCGRFSCGFAVESIPTFERDTDAPEKCGNPLSLSRETERSLRLSDCDAGVLLPEKYCLYLSKISARGLALGGCVVLPRVDWLGESRCLTAERRASCGHAWLPPPYANTCGLICAVVCDGELPPKYSS